MNAPASRGVPEATPAPPPDTGGGHSRSLAVLAVLAVVFVLDWAQIVFIPLVLGVVVSYALTPLVDRLQRWHVPRAVGAALVLGTILGGIGSLAYSLNDEAAGMIETLPQAAQKFRRTLQREWGTSKGAFDNMQQAASQLGRVASETAGTPALPRGVTRVVVEEPSFRLGDFLWNGTIGAFTFASLAVVVIFLTYFLLASGDIFRRKLVRLSGPTLARKRITVQMLDEISEQIQRYLLVQAATSMLVGVATWGALAWLGLDYPAVWGVVAAVANLVPYLGAIVITGGTTLVAFMQFESIAMAATVAAAMLVINVIEGNLLTPWLTGRASHMNAVVVFVGVLFWGWLWGAWGLLLGIPIMIAIKSVCDHVDDFRHIGEFLGR